MVVFCTSSPLSVVVFCWCCCWLWSNFSFHTVTALSWAVVLGSVQFSCNVVKCGEELHSPLTTELLHGLSVCRPDRSAAGLVRLLEWHFSNSIEIIWHSDTLTQLKSYQTNKYLFHFVKNGSNNNNSNWWQYYWVSKEKRTTHRTNSLALLPCPHIKIPKSTPLLLSIKFGGRTQLACENVCVHMWAFIIMRVRGFNTKTSLEEFSSAFLLGMFDSYPRESPVGDWTRVKLFVLTIKTLWLRAKYGFYLK